MSGLVNPNGDTTDGGGDAALCSGVCTVAGEYTVLLGTGLVVALLDKPGLSSVSGIGFPMRSPFNC